MTVGKLKTIKHIAVFENPGSVLWQNSRHRWKPKGVAKVATARKLAVRLYWMLRQNVGYPEIALIESSPRVALVCESYTEMLNGELSHPAVGPGVRIEASWPVVDGRIDGW